MYRHTLDRLRPTRFSLPCRTFTSSSSPRSHRDEVAFTEALHHILSHFQAPILFACAYGSGVFRQSNTKESASPHPHPPQAVKQWQQGGAKVIDFIIGVAQTQQWHSVNLGQHPNHYSGLRYLPYPSLSLSRIQSFGAGVYFNPYIIVNGTMIKYGVVSLNTLTTDLRTWNTLYLAGRMQKPVLVLKDNHEVQSARQENLLHALKIALLTLPGEFKDVQLYERIAGLSYLGDLRMNPFITGENPNKVSNIVTAQLPWFRKLYLPLMRKMPNLTLVEPKTVRDGEVVSHVGSSSASEDVWGEEEALKFQQDMDPIQRGSMIRTSPDAFQRKLYSHYVNSVPGAVANGSKYQEGGEFEQMIAKDKNLPDIIAKCVKSTVRWSSGCESVKAVFTAGLGKSWRYFRNKRKIS